LQRRFMPVGRKTIDTRAVDNGEGIAARAAEFVLSSGCSTVFFNIIFRIEDASDIEESFDLFAVRTSASR